MSLQDMSMGRNVYADVCKESNRRAIGKESAHLRHCKSGGKRCMHRSGKW
jgi:hypothetical protein